MSRQDDNKISLSKKGQREVSPFIGHELLYDYVSNSLDPERKAAVADHIKFSRDAQLDLEKIQGGQSYAEKLSQTVVSQAILERINTPSTYVTVLLQKTQFDKWPQGVKWGLEALFVVAAMVLLLTVTPWQRVFEWGQGLSSKEMILSEVPKAQTSTITEERPDFIDEELPEPAGLKAKPTATVGAVKATPSATSAVPSSPSPVAKQSPVAATTPTPVPSVAASVPPTPAAAATPAISATPPQASAVASSTPTPSSTTAAATGGGFLYRGQFAVTNIAVTGPKVTEKIASLGGRKAGSVELGWSKTPTSMYYHFTIPESRYPELVTFLQTYGAIRFDKEKHPRVMPDGIVRVILTVDEGQQ